MIPAGLDPVLYLIVIPLAFAAGLDLYLTLLLLGVASRVGWGGELPGNLAELGAGLMLSMAAFFYLLEFLAERTAPVSLFWNAAHSLIRLLGAALLVGLAFPEASWGILLTGGTTAVALAAVAHGARFGTRQLLRLAAARPPSFLLVSLGEDAVVLALVALALDFPAAGAGTTLALVVFALTLGRPALRASLFGLRLAMGVWASLLSPRGWRTPAHFPPWLRLAGQGDHLSPGGTLRGAPAGGWRVPGSGPFRNGWIVITGSGAFFVYRRLRQAHSIALTGARVRRVVERTAFRRVELQDSADRPFALLLPRDGPATDMLRAEFRRELPDPRVRPAARVEPD